MNVRARAAADRAFLGDQLQEPRLHLRWRLPSVGSGSIAGFRVSTDMRSLWHTPGLDIAWPRLGAGMAVANPLQTARNPHIEPNLNRSPR